MDVDIESLIGLPKDWVNEVEWENDTVLMVRYELLDIEKVSKDVLDFINKHGRDAAFNGSIEGCEHLHEVCKIGLTLIEDGEEYSNEDFASWLAQHLDDEVNSSFRQDAEHQYEAKLDGSWWRD
jgi:uncharacterized protein YggL (DUF469 family)